ncbi:MAG: restriction endonuclease subunit S [Anaerolineae bacterium]|nr:restriction endonuclease subunit S [Anaerolineae bacterium]
MSDWLIAAVGTVAREVSRPERIDNSRMYRLLGAHWYAKGLYVKEEKLGSEIRATALFAVNPGDFVYNRLFAWKGSFAVVQQEHAGCYVSNEFPCFELDRERIVPQFLWLYFSREQAWREALGLSSGSTPTSRNRLKQARFLAMKIPLPPLPEQRRIVARVEELAGQIAEARGLRERAREEASGLLPAVLARMFAQAEKETWPEKSLDEVAPVNMGQSPPGDTYNRDGEGLPLLNGPSEFGSKHPTSVQWTTSPTKVCKPGDILICVRGATTGRMNWADRVYCIGRGLAALTPHRSICIPDYLYYYLQHQTKMVLAEARGSTFPNLPGDTLRALRIPVPSLLEQHGVIAYLDQVQAHVDELRVLQEATQAELYALLPAVLERAFRGELDSG